MDVSRATTQISPSKPVTSIAHIQRAHLIREVYKSIFSDDSRKNSLLHLI
jgi:hypothetical protein